MDIAISIATVRPCYYCNSERDTRYDRTDGVYLCPEHDPKRQPNQTEGYAPIPEVPEQRLDGKYLEGRVIDIVLRYYANLPRSNYRQRYALSEQDQLACARFFAATASCELRHISAEAVPKRGHGVYRWFIQDHGLRGNRRNRNSCYRDFLALSNDWNMETYIDFLTQAAYLFCYVPWTQGYGGPAWASCCWYAAEWLREIKEDGFAEPMTWERWLGATHNNGPWLSKLGTGNMMYVLNAGFHPAGLVAEKFFQNFEPGRYSCYEKEVVRDIRRACKDVAGWVANDPDSIMAAISYVYQNYPGLRFMLLGCLCGLPFPRHEKDRPFRIPGFDHTYEKVGV